MNLEEILKVVNGLADEEKAKVIEALANPSNGNSTPTESTEAIEPEVESKEEVTEPNNEMVEEEIKSDEIVNEEVAAPVAEETAEGATEEVPSGEITETDVEEASNEEIPPMVKNVEESAEVNQQEAAQEAPALQDSDGVDMPIDFQQITDGLNARILALETENKQLRSKVDGAFGLSSKPSISGKVNTLYGDTSDIPPMRRN